MDNALPRKSPVGAQLGVGVRSASLYVGGRQGSDGRQSKWLGAYDDQLALDLSKLCISSKRCMVHDGLPIGQASDEADDEDEYLSTENEDMDDETQKHWNEVLLSRLKWDKLSPVIPPNLQYFKDVEFNVEHMYDVRQNQRKSLHDFVPENLISDLASGDLVSFARNKGKQSRKDLASYDPTVGNLIITGAIQTTPDLRNNYDRHQIVAYSCGKTSSVLKIAVLEETPLDEGSTRTESIRRATSIQLGSTIKSIKLPECSAMMDRKGNLIGVMTESALHLIKIESISARMEIKTSTCEPFPFQEFSDFPFADFACNPWDLQQFAVIDVRGNFGVGRLPKSFKTGNKARILRDHCGSIFDPEELSNWKRIEWSSSFTRLLVMDRSKLIELDYEQDWQLEVIQAKTWSKLQDYCRLDDDYGILLTNREIIVASTKETSEHFKREISWKHDLDPNDSTLKFCIRKVSAESKTIILVVVFSRNHSSLYIHSFSISSSESLVQSAGTPVILQIPHIKSGLRGIWLHNSTRLDPFGRPNIMDTCLSLFVNETNGNKIWQYVISNNSTKLENWDAKSDAPDISPATKNERTWPEHLRDTIAQIKQSLVLPEKTKDQSAEDQLLQTYAYRLSEAINERLSSLDGSQESLGASQPLVKDLIEMPQDVSLRELSSMLSQLFNHYEDQAVTFTSFDTISCALLNEKTGDLEVLYNKLLQCWDLVTSNSEYLTQSVVKDVVYSCMRLCKPSLYKDAEANLFESLSIPSRDIISMWDDENTQSSQPPADASSVSHLNILASSQSQIPSIKSSQSRPSKKHKKVPAGLTTGRVSKPSSLLPSSQRDADPTFSLLSSSQPSSTLPDTMTPAFTLMQPSGPSLSQSQSSQRSRRKKKRVGGFG